jgi:hypothetical protein
MKFIVAMAAAIDKDSQRYVHEKNISSTFCIYSLFPTSADIGIPLPIDFPKAAKSGVTQKCF